MPLIAIGLFPNHLASNQNIGQETYHHQFVYELIFASSSTGKFKIADTKNNKIKNCFVSNLIKCPFSKTRIQKITLNAKNGGVPILPNTKYEAWWNRCNIGLFGAINNAKKYNVHIIINHRPIVYLSRTKTLNDVLDL